MRPNTYNPDCDFDPDQRDLDASIKERNKTESDATDDNFKIEPISQHTLKVPVQYKGQAEPLDFTEPDATERARAELEVKYQQAKEFYQAYRTPEMKLYNYPIGAMLTSFLESETPRIKAEAVREFIAEFHKELSARWCEFTSDHDAALNAAEETVKGQRKEMTEDALETL